MIGSVYKITNLINHKAYIGITMRDPINRWWEHCNNAQKDSNYFIHQAIRKYGEENFSIIILAQTKSVKHLKELEIILIKEHGTHMSTQMGYNKTWGGDGETTYGKAGAIDSRNGKRLGVISLDDPRWANGEIIHCLKGIPRSEEYKKSSSEMWKGKRKGSENTNAKKFLLTSPEGKEYEIHGNCCEFVKSLGLKHSALYDYINKGIPVPPPSKFHIKNATTERLNTIGWSLKRIPQ